MEVRPGESFPVLELVEYRLGNLDFAVARLGPNAAGDLPGAAFGRLVVAVEDIADEEAMLCIIQHPNGSPKKVEAGPMQSNVGGQISYDSLDTQGGSSGSPIVSLTGEIVGVHTNGGCTAFSGFNFGVAVMAIRGASSHMP
ncbi:MAG: trypsin-like peptidase domain-containing protein [Planctomycetaceae bacterium]|nr:trypsin-like peptidase domain-containing protein [Planctomycetaceae bacterium]